MSTWSDIGTVGTAALSAIAAFGSWKAARRANDTSRSVARIEAERWAVEQTPRIGVSFEPLFRRVRLYVFLEGPQHLQAVESLAVEVLDDDHDRSVNRPGGPTPEEISKQIWGPYQFMPDTDGVDENGRRVTVRFLSVGSSRSFEMQRTRPPHWQTSPNAEANWYPHHPIRLRLTCRHGNQEWVIVKSVSTETPHDGNTDLYEEPDV
ncbi:hypothetical protein [Streptomyces sp. S1]|uniref:hypothetical protein n=1 Tax=Streptomyces sp. S1 TaxID=718288 RepID=UPI003D736A00